MITKATYHFLQQLRDNNDREWFQSHKGDYQKALDEYKSLVRLWYENLAPHDEDIAANDPAKAIFRIYRDVRFSPNKSPYKDHFGASLARGGRTSSWAGYYLHISPGANFFAGGKWMPQNAELKKIRQEIDYNYEQFREILEAPEFMQLYGELDTEHSLKTSPRDYPADHPAIDLLKLKSFIVTTTFSDEEAIAPDFPQKLAHWSIVMQPFLSFLNTALEEPES